MSETKWIPYEEELDHRPKTRPKVKHIIIYENYPLNQLYEVIQVMLIVAAGWFLSLLVNSDPTTTILEVYTLKFLFCVAGALGCSVLYYHKIDKEEFIEDLQ
jgi:hypothetical protein